MLSATAAVFRALGAGRRRRLLSVLLDHGEPMSIADVATEIATIELDRQIVATEDRDRIRVSLIHKHVPHLIDAGLLDAAPSHPGGTNRSRPRQPRTVQLTDAVVHEAPWIRRLVATEPVDGGTSLDRTLQAVAPDRRRMILTALAECGEPRPVAEVASKVAEREAECSDETVDADADAVRATLRHEHLPALADAGVLRYDGEHAEIDREAPLWSADWLPGSPLADVVKLLVLTPNPL